MKKGKFIDIAVLMAVRSGKKEKSTITGLMTIANDIDKKMRVSRKEKAFAA